MTDAPPIQCMNANVQNGNAWEAALPAFNRARNITNENTLIAILKTDLLADIIKNFHSYHIEDDVESERMELVAKYNFCSVSFLYSYVYFCFMVSITQSFSRDFLVPELLNLYFNHLKAHEKFGCSTK